MVAIPFIHRLMHADPESPLGPTLPTESFDSIVAQFKQRIFGLCFSMVHDTSLAEDLTQDVLLRIWKALPTFNGRASLSTWIYTITRNTCLTEIKRRASRPTVSLDSPEMEFAAESFDALHATPPEPGLESETQSLLSQLPVKYRQVLVLFYLEQKSYEFVAAMLGIPLGTVKTLLFRAKRELAQISTRRDRAAANETFRDRSKSSSGRKSLLTDPDPDPDSNPEPS